VTSAMAASRDLLRSMLDAAVAAALPARIAPVHLPEPPKGRTIVVGVGKASAAMAQALEQHWPGPLEGLVATRYGHAVPCQRIEIVEAAHPVPDAVGCAWSPDRPQPLGLHPETPTARCAASHPRTSPRPICPGQVKRPDTWRVGKIWRRWQRQPSCSRCNCSTPPHSDKLLREEGFPTCRNRPEWEARKCAIGS
jgi:hypothetical protein